MFSCSFVLYKIFIILRSSSMLVFKFFLNFFMFFFNCFSFSLSRGLSTSFKIFYCLLFTNRCFSNSSRNFSCCFKSFFCFTFFFLIVIFRVLQETSLVWLKSSLAFSFSFPNRLLRSRCYLSFPFSSIRSLKFFFKSAFISFFFNSTSFNFF